MIKRAEATFDGEFFRPDEPIQLEPNTRIRIIVESVSAAEGKAPSLQKKRNDG